MELWRYQVVFLPVAALSLVIQHSNQVLHQHFLLHVRKPKQTKKTPQPKKPEKTQQSILKHGITSWNGWPDNPSLGSLLHIFVLYWKWKKRTLQCKCRFWSSWQEITVFLNYLALLSSSTWNVISLHCHKRTLLNAFSTRTLGPTSPAPE